MNYILKESLDRKSFSLRPDVKGWIIRNRMTKEASDVGNEIKIFKGANESGNVYKDVLVCSDLSTLIEKGTELSAKYGLELKISKRIKRSWNYCFKTESEEI